MMLISLLIDYSPIDFYKFYPTSPNIINAKQNKEKRGKPIAIQTVDKNPSVSLPLILSLK